MVDPNTPYEIRKAAAILHLKDARVSFQLAQETLCADTVGLPGSERGPMYQILEQAIESFELLINKLAKEDA